MTNIKFIGKDSYQEGKTLWEILGNLKNLGVGRLVTRGTHKRYTEPCFFKIVKVETVENEEKPYQNRKVIAWIEKIFRGHRFPTLIETYASTYKPDFQLIPKDEEEIWYKRLAECKHRTKLIHPTVPLPPLLKIILATEQKKTKESENEDHEIPLQILNTPANAARLAEEGEKATVRIKSVIGSPTSPLYANIDASRHLFVDKNAWEESIKEKVTKPMNTIS